MNTNSDEFFVGVTHWIKEHEEWVEKHRQRKEEHALLVRRSIESNLECDVDELISDSEKLISYFSDLDPKKRETAAFAGCQYKSHDLAVLQACEKSVSCESDVNAKIVFMHLLAKGFKNSSDVRIASLFYSICADQLSSESIRTAASECFTNVTGRSL